MKTDIKHLAAYVATTIWADGVYDEAEKIIVEEIADAFEIKTATLASEIEAALAEIENKTEDEIDEYLREHSIEIEEEEAEMVYLAALQIALVDNVLGVEEVSNLLAIASTLGIDDEIAILHLVELVKEEPELEVAF